MRVALAEGRSAHPDVRTGVEGTEEDHGDDGNNEGHERSFLSANISIMHY
jgi:hypothetical protein